jgi:hypothetical protein
MAKIGWSEKGLKRFRQILEYEVSNGIYFYPIQVSDFSETKKIVIIK